MWLPIYACLEGEHFTSGLLVIHKGRDFPKIPGGGDPQHHFQLERPERTSSQEVRQREIISNGLSFA